jgi:DsbC/DsbD-like thiol-disulfide interchange protein
MIKKLMLTVIVVLAAFAVNAQIMKPVTWSYAAKKTSKNEATVFLKATIQPGWHIYSQYLKEGGPIPTSFTFTPSKAFILVGKTIEPKPKAKFEETFAMNVSYFDNSVVFQQKVKLNTNETTVKGTLEYMVCNDKQCLPPTEVAFNIAVK